MFALGLCQSFKFILDSSDFDNKFSRVLELFLQMRTFPFKRNEALQLESP